MSYGGVAVVGPLRPFVTDMFTYGAADTTRLKGIVRFDNP